MASGNSAPPRPTVFRDLLLSLPALGVTAYLWTYLWVEALLPLTYAVMPVWVSRTGLLPAVPWLVTFATLLFLRTRVVAAALPVAVFLITLAGSFGFAMTWGSIWGSPTAEMVASGMWRDAPPNLIGAAVCLAWAWWRLRPRRVPGTCRHCGYDLTGNVSGLCPECGHTCAAASKPRRQ